MKKVLITGANGFVAKHLIKKIHQYGEFEIYATTHSDTSHNINEIAIGTRILKMDLNNKKSIQGIINEVWPDVIFHLAAQSNVPYSWIEPYETFRINTLGTIALIDVMQQIKSKSKLIIVGSSDEYGLTAKSKALLDETDHCLPQNPYSISKYAVSQYVQQVIKKVENEIIYLRPFNHFGPYQKRGFVVSDFCSQIAMIEANIKEQKILVGDILTFRDITPVSDIVNAYYMAITEKLESGIYNISSGKSISIEEILRKLISFSTSEIIIEIDQSKYRPTEVKKFAGNSNKFKQQTGWNPLLDIDNELNKTLDWWRSEIGRGIIV